MAQFSYSRVDAFKQCPFKFKLRYIDKVECYQDIDNASNALIIGTAMHTGLDKGVDEAIKEYRKNYFISSDAIEEECIKFKHLIPLAQQVLPDGELTFEYKLECDDFIGYIDLLVKKPDGKYAIYDFKYSNNVSSYKASAQLHLYKFLFEKLNENTTVDELGFIFIPKTSIRMKKTENRSDFRKRLYETLDTLNVKTEKIEYQPEKVINYLIELKHAIEATDFPKCFTRLCEYCSYSKYCKLGYNYMTLPANIKRNAVSTNRIKMWLYGEPFSGKTNFANQFPNALFLNTDGNIDSFDSPYIETKEWQTFLDTIEDLKSDTSYQTVIVDLVEDLYEACRRYCLTKLGIQHETDDNFKAWDYVTNEFLTAIKEFIALPKHIIFISHADSSREYVTAEGVTKQLIRPNIREKIANKIAGSVDIVCRLKDNDLYIRGENNIFGGTRLPTDVTNLEPKYENVLDLYKIKCTMVEEIPTEQKKIRRRKVVE